MSGRTHKCRRCEQCDSSSLTSFSNQWHEVAGLQNQIPQHAQFLPCSPLSRFGANILDWSGSVPPFCLKSGCCRATQPHRVFHLFITSPARSDYPSLLLESLGPLDFPSQISMLSLVALGTHYKSSERVHLLVSCY